MVVQANYATLYAEVTEALGFESCVQELVRGTAELIDVEEWDEQPFPPALIPMYSEPAGNIVGIWKHWCYPTRETTIVNFSGRTRLGEPRIAFELATSVEQLKFVYFLNMLAYQQEVTSEVRADGETLQFDHFNKVKKVLSQHGQRLNGLLDLEEFKTCPPQACFQDDPSGYSGGFPNVNSTLEEFRLACSYEVHNWYQEDEYELRNQLAGNSDSPPWLRSMNQLATFNALLDVGNVSGAWMTLNSIGWNVGDARVSIQRLSEIHQDPLFSKLAIAWSQIPLDPDAEY